MKSDQLIQLSRPLPFYERMLRKSLPTIVAGINAGLHRFFKAKAKAKAKAIIMKYYLPICLLLLIIACQETEPLPLPNPLEPSPSFQEPSLAQESNADSCLYQFDANLAHIYGVWEPQQIINLEDSDTAYYEYGAGHLGFMLKDHYADAFELRPDSSMSLYYVAFGRFCASRIDGSWYMAEDTLYISRFEGDDTRLRILSSDETHLEMEDVINFKASQVIYRKGR